MRTIGIIPARFASSRFPGKPLALIGDKSMLRRVYERVRLSGVNEVIIATDDKRIANHAESFGAKIIMTSVKHNTGTERIEEAYRKLKKEYDIVINIQGDEPFIDPAHIRLLIKSFQQSDIDICTLADEFDSQNTLESSNSIKVVTDCKNNALYFSRAVIPFQRDTEKSQWLTTYNYLKHIGVYAFRSEVLTKVVKLKPAEIEKAESLEQLRWIYSGYNIRVLKVKYYGVSVDTPDDLEKANNILNEIYF